MATFADLEFKPHPHGLGVQARHNFENGYGVSVVRGEFSYGGPEGLYELAVRHPSVGLVYDTPVTDDVLGHLTEDDVTRHMAEVAALPERVSA
jgi:hypothetical protein